MPRRSLAKLTRPRLENVLARERVFRRLDECLARPLVWVSAPPGAGKTTAVAGWLESRGLPCLWYQADAADGDVATFFYYLGLAAPRRKRPLPLFTPEYLVDPVAFSHRYFRELFGRLPAGAVVVLDNFQDVPESSVFHRLVAAGAEEVPEGKCLLCVSRQPPPAALSRAFLAGKVAQVLWADLELSEAEVRVIAGAHRGMAETDFADLYRRAGGWVGGVVLLLEGGRSAVGPSGGTGVRGTPEGVFEYLGDQVFRTLPENQQTALMRMSVLPSVSERCAVALGGTPEAAAWLAVMVRRHLFIDLRVVADVDGRPVAVYQFHALFRDFLLARATTELGRDVLSGLLREGAALLASEGQTQGALDASLAAHDWEFAAEVILANAQAMLSQGRWETLESAIGRLPARTVDSNPWLLFWLGSAVTQTRPADGVALLQAAAEGLERNDDRMGAALAISAVLHGLFVGSGDFPAMGRWLPRLEPYLEDADTFPSPAASLRVTSGFQFAASYVRPDHPRLRETSLRVARSIEDHRIDPNLRVQAAGSLMPYFTFAWHPAEAAQVCATVAELTAGVSVTPLTEALWQAYRGLYFHCHGDDARESERSLLRALAIAEEHRFAELEFMACQFYGYLCMTRARERDGTKLLERMARLPNAANPESAMNYHANAMFLAAFDGRTEHAYRHAESSLRLAERMEAKFFSIAYGLITASAFASAGDIDRAREVVARVRSDTVGTYYTNFEALVRANEAFIALCAGDVARCHERLVAMFDQVREAPNQIVFLRWSYPALTELFAEALRAGLHPELVRRCIRELSVRPPEEDAEGWPWPVRIRTLGGFEVQAQGRPVVLSRKAPRVSFGVLKRLLCAGSLSLAESELTDALWPEHEGDKGYRALVSALHRLRALLGEAGAVRHSGGTVWLDRTVCWVDRAAFERDAESEAPERWMRALRGYGGEFLAGHAELAEARPVRARLRARCLELALRAGRAAQQAGRWDEAVFAYERGVAADGQSEAHYRGLVESHLKAGRREQAEAAYRAMCASLPEARAGESIDSFVAASSR